MKLKDKIVIDKKFLEDLKEKYLLELKEYNEFVIDRKYIDFVKINTVLKTIELLEANSNPLTPLMEQAVDEGILTEKNLFIEGHKQAKQDFLNKEFDI